MMSPSKETVVVTGFGLFGGYQVNSSWVAASVLAEIGLGLENVKLEIKEIPVEYEAIDKKVPQLFKKHKPILMVHVGVSGLAQTFELEQCAHNDGYNRCDVKDKCPKHEICKKTGPAMLHSTIDMKAITESDELKEAGVLARVSHDAGRYCCDYIYYSSLSMHECPVIFIHVPPLNQRFDGKTLAVGLRAIIRATLKHIGARNNVHS